MTGGRVARGIVAVVIAAAVTLTAACTSGESGSSETPTGASTSAPPRTPAELLDDAAAAMSEVTTARFTLAVEGELSNLPLTEASGELTAAGDAQGTAVIRQFGQLVEVEFVLVDDQLYLKSVTGGFAEVPAAVAGQVYDPSAILDPTTGVAAVLAGTTSPADAGTDGDLVVVTGTVPRDVAAGVVPGITTDVAGEFGIDPTTNLLATATFELEGSDGKPASVAVTLSDLDAPVEITPPE